MPNTPLTKADLVILGLKIGALTEAFEATDKFAEETRAIATKAEKASSDAFRAMVATLIVSLALIVLVGFGFFLFERGEDNRELLDLQRNYDVASCERANDVRAGQRQQWIDARTLLIDLGAGAQTRKLADGLVANANKNFPALDCSLVRLGQVPQPITPTPTTKANKPKASPAG